MVCWPSSGQRVGIVAAAEEGEAQDVVVDAVAVLGVVHERGAGLLAEGMGAGEVGPAEGGDFAGVAIYARIAGEVIADDAVHFARIGGPGGGAHGDFVARGRCRSARAGRRP